MDGGNAMLLRCRGTQRNGRNGDKRNVTEVPMAHRETEGTEINAILRRCDGTKSDGDIAYRFLVIILG